MKSPATVAVMDAVSRPEPDTDRCVRKRSGAFLAVS